MNTNATRCLVLLAPMLAAACGSADHPVVDPAPPEAVDVRVDVVARRPLSRSFEVGGVIRARTTASIVGRVVAVVREVRVRPGDRVRRGEPLVVLDDRDLAARRQAAEASARAAVQGATAAEAERAAATAALELAQVTYERIRALRQRNSATPQELDQALAGSRAAEARLGGAEARVAEAEAAVEAARAASEAAAVMASFAVLDAPFDGLVTETLTEAGNMAAPGTPLVTIEDTSGFRLEVLLDESRMQEMTLGRVVEVDLDVPGGAADRVDTVEGRVAEVARALDAGTHSYLVKIDLAPDAPLRSGMFGRARISEPVRSGLAVPATSVVRHGQLTLVYVVDADGAARMRPVRIGPSTPDGVEVLAGLEEGERVVGAPPASMTDGTSVRAEGRP